jgi:glycosyltransferase involved in cell wall biosynthesis
MTNVRQIECHPGYGWHAYQECFAQAVAPHGFVSKAGGEFSSAMLRESSADILHFHWIERLWDTPSLLGKVKCLVGIYRYLRLAKQLNKKIMWTVHNHYPHENNSFIDRVGLALFAKFSDLIITHSEWSKAWIIKRFSQAVKPIVMPHGNFKYVFSSVAGNKALLTDFGLSPEKFTSGMIGVIRPNRGHELAIEVAKTILDTQLIIVGRNNDKAYFNDLKKLAAGCDNIVIREVDLSNDRYNELVALCDVVLLPYSDITTSGALLSSWTIGTPVITSNLPFFAEFCAQTNAGISLSYNTALELKVAIEEFVILERSSTRENAIKEADKYDWEAVVKPVTKHMLNWF